MGRLFSRSFMLILLALFCQLSALAQGTTGAIAGTVVDQSGANVPNAAVTVRSESSGQEFNTQTDDNGVYRVPALGTGFYTVTVTASNFKKVVVANVKVDVGTPSTVDVTLEAGNITESVTISGGGEVLQTQTATVGTTITGRQITEVPLTSRDALDLITLLPGTATVGRPRASSINGLPKGSLSITIDGVDVQDNLLRSSDGFFTYVRPRLDAIEEVNVSTAAPGSESSGDGAVQIKFVTKRGTNDYRGSAFWQHRDVSLNSNYWWNNTLGQPRTPIVLNQYGGSFGGPIPFLNFGEGVPVFNSGRDRAFFFVSYEEFRIPEAASRTRKILNPAAESGNYIYNSSGASINVLQRAAARGFTGTVDPTIASLLSSIRSATGQGQVAANALNYQDFSFFNLSNQRRHFLAVRADFNLSKRHSLENVTNYQLFRNPSDFLNNVDPAFPGFPSYGTQNSDRYSNSTALRSTITDNIINEARYSFSGGLSLFRENLTPEVFQNQSGFNLNPNVASLTTAGQSLGLAAFTPTNSNNRRVSPTFDFSDNVTWIIGKHTLGLGGQYKRIKLRTASINQAVPNITFGFGPASTQTVPGDLVRDFFTTTNFPELNTTQLGEAAALYALLTGRVQTVTANAYLADDGTYQFLGDQLQRAKQNIYGLYIQDRWNIKSNLTLNFGVRWQPQEAFTVSSENFSRAETFADVYGVSGLGNLFSPGVRRGVPRFVGVEPGERAYENDFNNFAPSVGFAWTPNFENKFLKTVFGGDRRSVIRAGYSMAFVREGTNVLTSIFGANPGSSLPATRSVNSSGALNLPIGTLLRDLATTGYTPPNFSSTPTYPIFGSENTSTNVFDPNLKTGYVHSWNVGFQRELDKNTVIEVRYVGNRGKDLWRQYNINEYNVTENGFAAEFRLAQANLLANEAAFAAGQTNRRTCLAFVNTTTGACQVSATNTTPVARVPTFTYFGAGTGTSPLPIISAYASGPAGTYPLSFFANTALINFLSPRNANVIGFAQNIDGVGAQRTNATNAGLAPNFFIVNPTTRNGAFIVDNSANSWYNALVIEVNRRLSQGLLVQGSYTFSKSMSDSFASSATASNNFATLRDRSLNKTLSPFDLRHSIKVNWVYELPLGNGKPLFTTANRWTDALIGGWSVIGAARWQSGSPINFGNVQLVGMTAKELEKEIGVYYNTEVPNALNGTGSRISPATYLPSDIIRNTMIAFSSGSPTGRFIAPPGYGNCVQEYVGQCGFSNLVLHGPDFFKLDLSLSKRFRIDEKRNIELRGAFYNAINNHPFRIGGWALDVVNAQGAVSSLAVSERLGGLEFGQFKNGSVYQDTSTTNDPGGRIVELILRINF